MRKELEKVEIDVDKLYSILSERKITKENFSYEIGRGKTFISSLRLNCIQPANVEKLMCKCLDLPPMSLVKSNEKTVTPPDASAKVLENIHRLLVEIRQAQEELANQNERILSKVNANTIQLEKVKDCVREAVKTDYDKAVDFLKETLVSGRMDGADLLRYADAAGHKRADIMKAKNELAIRVVTTGYGKNQKAVWIMDK